MAKEPKKEEALIRPAESFTTGTEFVRSLMDLRARGAIVLTPVTFVQRPPVSYGYGLTFVEISLEVRAKEVYHDPRWADGELALTHRGLARLWNAAGGEWEWTRRADDGKDAFIAEIEAKGRMKDLQGQWHSAMKRSREDYRDGQPQVLGFSPKQVLEARRKITERAESKAQNRVIRELLNVRDSYHRDELAMPFVLAKLVYEADMSDPYVRQEYTRHALYGREALFGPEPEPSRPALMPPTPAALLDDLDLDPPLEEETPNQDDDEIQQQVMDFQAADLKQQVEILNTLIDKKKYDRTKLMKPLEKMEPRHRLGFYAALRSMPDAA